MPEWQAVIRDNEEFAAFLDRIPHVSVDHTTPGWERPR